jgi:pimeloyl-ACP methyl ester carboxylesterase
MDFLQGGLAPHEGFAISGDGSSTAMLAFGGIAGGLLLPPFEFFRLAEDIPVVKIFVRDHEQAWYQCGVRGLGNDIPSVAEELRRFLTQRGVSRVVAFGNSSGGFGALLFGSLLGVDRIVTFAPQTIMTRAFRARTADFRWFREARSMRRKLPATAILDVRSALMESRVPAEIYVSPQSFYDWRQARRLADLPNVTLHRRDRGGHRLVKQMRDSGELQTIVRSSLDAAGAEPR